jgi:hypothetical protein
MKNKQDYQDLVNRGYKLEQELGNIYLVDECVDRENVNTEYEENSPQWWNSLFNVGESAIAFRLVELGFDPNSYGFEY